MERTPNGGQPVHSGRAQSKPDPGMDQIAQDVGSLTTERTSNDDTVTDGDRAADGSGHTDKQLADKHFGGAARYGSEEFLRLVLWATRVGIWEWHIESNAVTWSEETLRIFGLAQDEFHGQFDNFRERVHADDQARVRERLREVIESTADDSAYCTEHRIIWPSGETRWVESKGLLIRDSTGARRRMLGIMVDITARKRAEEQAHLYREELARMGRVKAAGEMASNLAHELNQPLTAIAVQAGLATAQLHACSDAEAVARLQPILNEIVDQAQRAGSIIHMLRDLVKKGNVQRAPIQINQVIRDVIALIEPQLRTRHIRLTHRLTDLPHVTVDKIQIGQLLLNLLQNAIDAIVAKEAGERLIEVATERDGNNGVLILVRDSGNGIRAEDMERIFESFFTTKEDGMGMGLAICRSIANAHHARMWAVSKLGEGTTFFFRLPLDVH